MDTADRSRILQEDPPELIELCTGRVRDGRDFYAFLQMDVESYRRYREALSGNGPLDLNAFGRVVHAGWGKAPDAQTAAWVRETYTDNSKIVDAIVRDAGAVTDILKRNSKERETQ